MRSPSLAQTDRRLTRPPHLSLLRPLQSFYTSRWNTGGIAAPPCGTLHCWQLLYSAKLASQRSWSGRYATDSLYSHTAGVRCVKLLPAANLLASGGLDKTLRLWDLSAGMPACAPRPMGSCVRGLALDREVLAVSRHSFLVSRAAAAVALLVAPFSLRNGLRDGEQRAASPLTIC